MGETIVLPKSGVVLTMTLDGGPAPEGQSLPSPEYLSYDFQCPEWTANVTYNADPRALWGVGWSARMLHQLGGVFSGRDECIAWLDARVLETRAALTPPGHVLVGPDARERIARALCPHGLPLESMGEWARERYYRDAGAVLVALGVRSGA